MKGKEIVPFGAKPIDYGYRQRLKHHLGEKSRGMSYL